MSGTEPLEWRAVIALLANARTRTALAEVVGGAVPSGPDGERALARLTAAGLVEEDAQGRLVVAEDRLRATLKAAAPEPTSGAERFLTRDGRIADYPSRWSDRYLLLHLLAGRLLEPEEDLSEEQLGERLDRVTDDGATLRRYLVDAGLLSRSPDGRSYRRESGPAGE